jgi:hypothetical protein
VSENEAQKNIEERDDMSRGDRYVTWAALSFIGLGILGFAAHNDFFPSRGCKYPNRSACIANLKNIEGAKATWALENHKETNAVPTDADLFGRTLYISEKPPCPGNGTYTLGAVSEKPRCSIRGHTL